MTNIVDVYINYLRRKVDFGYDRALTGTIRGVGYQVGGNGRRCEFNFPSSEMIFERGLAPSLLSYAA